MDNSEIFNIVGSVSADVATSPELENKLQLFSYSLLNVLREFASVNDAFDVPSHLVSVVTESSRNTVVNSLNHHLREFDENQQRKLIAFVDSIVESANIATRLIWEQIIIGHGEDGKSIYETARDSMRESILRAQQNASPETRGQQAPRPQPGGIAGFFRRVGELMTLTPATTFGEMYVNPTSIGQPPEKKQGNGEPDEQSTSAQNQPETANRSRVWRVANAIVEILAPKDIFIP